jgi:pyroglutamyl-peptidase
MKILITGFGPFPGAPFNPTEPLVRELARRRHPANVRRVGYVFRVSYEAVDRELPALLAREQPDALIMFGLAGRTRHLRVETLARNTLTRTVPDAGGKVPAAAIIAAGGPDALPLRAPAQKLVMAARSAGVQAARSRDAGSYLCNYLCWRAAEGRGTGAPRLIAFIHVPRIFRPSRRRVPACPSLRPGQPKAGLRCSRLITLDDLIEAGEAIVRAAIATLRSPK